jgi:hypothetical protein
MRRESGGMIVPPADAGGSSGHARARGVMNQMVLLKNKNHYHSNMMMIPLVE